MKRNSSIDKASDFWSGTKISDIVMSIFNCGCGPRESKDQRNAKDNQIMEDEGTPAPSKQYKFQLNFDLDRSPPKNESPQRSFTFTFDQGLKNSKKDNKFPDLYLDDEDENSERSKDRSSLFTGGDDDGSKQTETEERLSTASKKISRRSQKAADKNADKKVQQARRPWQPNEDKQLLELMKELGPSWAAISKRMGGSRSGKQVRDRYLNKLDPKIKSSEWTETEDNLLVSLYHKLGKKWSEIAKNIPGRTESMVKNRVQWRFRWMVSDNPEDQPPMPKQEEIQSNNEGNNNSNLMVPEEPFKTEFVEYQPESQKIEEGLPQNFEVENRNQQSIFENFENFSQQNYYPQDRMQIDSLGLPQENQYYTSNQEIFQNQANFQDADNFSLMDYFDKRGSNERMAKPSSDPFLDNIPAFDINNQQNRQSGGYAGPYNEQPLNRDVSRMSEDQKIQERINYISNILKGYPGAENWSETVQKSMLDNSTLGISKEDAARRVELLKQRLVSLETILQVTYQQVFQAHGKELHQGSV